MRFIFGLVFCLALVSQTLAGVHGLNTTFNPAQFPGATVTHLTCDGTSADNTAWAAWRTASIAANPTPAALVLTPGAPSCNVTGGATNSGLIAGVTNPIIWGYGASVTTAFLSQGSFFNDSAHSSLINTVSAGATQVTVNDGTIAIYNGCANVCRIAVTGLANQTTGFPPSHILIEYKKILGISGNVITVSSPLANTYKATWPLIGNTNPFLGGPAAIYLMVPAWDSTAEVYGLTVNAGGGATGLSARQISLIDVDFLDPDGVSPSASDIINFTRVRARIIELDKEINYIQLDYTSANQLICQTGCANRLVANSSKFGGSNALFGVLGTTISATFNNSILSFGGSQDPGSRIGSSVAIGSSDLTLNGSLVKGANPSTVQMEIADLTFSAGVLSIAKTAPNYFVAVSWGAPGKTYYFGARNTAVGASPVTFQISDMTEDATNVYYAMSNCSWGACSGALPVPDCDIGVHCDAFIAYPQTSVTQINSQAGSDNLDTGTYRP